MSISSIKKQIRILTLLLFLMFTLLFMKDLFIEDIQNVALSNNNIQSFTEYKLGEDLYSISLPSGWIVENEYIESELFKAKITDGNTLFADISIISNTESVDSIFNNIINEKNIDGVQSYSESAVRWNVLYYESSKKNDIYMNRCYLREYSEGKVLIIDFSLKKKDYKPSIVVVLDKIVKSFK